MISKHVLRSPFVQASIPTTAAFLLTVRVLILMASRQEIHPDLMVAIMFASWTALLVLASNGVQGIVAALRSVLGRR